MKIKYALTTIVLVLVVVSLGCQSRDSDGEPEPAPEESAQAADVAVQIYNGTGVVMNITPSGGHVVVRHQEIEGFMSAMTMPFEVRDDSLLQLIAVGDSIDFEISHTDDGTYISAIEIVE